MSLAALMRMTALSTILSAGINFGAAAQTTAADAQQPHARLAQATTGQGPEPVQPGQPAQPGMMHPGMMCDMMQSGMMGGMSPRGHMLKVFFAIADTNGDGALSFEEVTAIHKRIFDKIDANKDGKVTIEELQAFMRE